MPYQVLARKYRPQRFADVIGQDHVTRTLANALEQGRIAHGYIFSGHRGIGKTTIARILAMALNCRRTIGSPERPTFEPCGTCESCTEIRAGNAVDVIEIDAATNRGIDEIRELRDAARYRPARDRYKIYILDEAHQITDAAFNALLKTLEEPPDHVVFMMATTEPENILQTIRSRCQHYSFHAVRFDEILRHLETIAQDEGIDAEPEALGLLAEAGDGSMRDALSIMDQAIASAPVIESRPRLEAEPVRALMGTLPNAVFARLLEQVSEGSSAGVLTELDRLLAAGNSPVQLARQMVRYLRNVLMAKIGGEQTELLQLSPDERARAAVSAMLFGEEDLTRFLQVMLRTANELTYRHEQRFHLELALLKLVHLERLLPFEELLSQLGGRAGSATGANATPGTRPSAAPSRPATEAGARSTPAQTHSPAPRSPETPAPREPRSPQPPPELSPFARDQQRRAPAPAAPSPRQSTGPAPVAAVSHGALAVAEGPEISSASAAPALALHVQPEAPELENPHEQPVSMQDAPADETSVPSAALAEGLADAPHGLDLEAMRTAATEALSAAGHTTAATLLNAAQWSEQPDTIRIEVGARKVMLGLTFNADADRIVRAAIRPFAGSPPRAIQWIPGESSAEKPAARPAAVGSIQADALNHPLVQQAKQLFGAEVRSIVDLRSKR